MSNKNTLHVGNRRHRGPISSPPCSHSLNPLYIFFCDYMKYVVLIQTIKGSVEDFAEVIVVPNAEISTPLGIFEKVQQSFIRWCSTTHVAITFSICYEFFSEQ
ncbi:hypothetical protein TNIN_35161 [Trichonephila inaurata madagascariensis]|uniref:Uncharacterized protein n=1 Tax=Trichonephila inaurata madagascariensis TaxID=2747483 RepID=A0A8X6YDV0_9ARAC|nr:hypothetical protein TNIN_3391 [Trichonephila inaurata madagascariensis]GFY70493.1 hypothetical protein TNIN_41521 [Trichonephila inaurata madagascariensis]GFY77220.1 hypothetical protein TNIN_35161 [Trichonephila inaurata madagascariensis]